MEKVNAAKKHIDDLFQRRMQGKDNRKIVAQALNKDIGTDLTGGNKYILEFIQNADDAESDNNKHSLEMQFVLTENYLVVSHNGKQFDKDDVEKICNYANQEQGEKIEDANKTGYKNVGFKTVFTIANRVQIISDVYKFCFDKNHSEWKGNYLAFPWQITPIWDEKIPDEIKSFINSTQVNFIISIDKINSPKIDEELKYLKEKPEIILFLRRINKIDINLLRQGIEEKFTIQKQESEGNIDLLVNGVAQKWIIKKIEKPIDAQMSAYLNSLNEYQCPAKLKTAKTYTITFAGKLTQDEKLEVISNGLAFNTLPTQVKLGLPIHVNASFLLNSARSGFVENNHWNKFLLEKIAYFHIEWLGELAKFDRYRYSILNYFYLLESSIVNNDNYLNAFKTSRKKAIQEIAFLPSQINHTKLLKLAEGYIDETGFFTEVIQFEKVFSVSIEKLKYLVKYEETKDTIKDRYIDMLNLKSKLCSYETQFKDPIVNKKAIEFFTNKLSDKDQDRDHNIASIKFVLTTENQLVSINELFLPTEGMPTLPGCIKIDLLHNELTNDKRIINWLKLQGAQDASMPSIIEAKIYELIKKPELITKENTIEVTRFIFACHEAKALDQFHYQDLQLLPLQTSQGRFEHAVNCYLGDSYKPRQPLQQLVPEINFVCKQYLTCDSLDEKLKWREFFKLIAVKENVEYFHCHSIKRSELVKIQIPQISSYFENLKTLRKSPSQGKFDEHKIINFISINHIDNLHNTHFATLFFRHINTIWQDIKQYLCNSKYQMISNKKGNDLAMHETYLVYYLRNCAYVTASDGERYRTQDLLIPRYHHLQRFDLKILNLNADIEINEEIYEIFGFKTQLQLKDIVEILIKIEDCKLSKNELIEIYTLIFKELFKVSQKSKQADVMLELKQSLSKYENKSLKLLAVNTTLKPSNQLTFYPNIDNEQLDGNYLKFLPTCSIEEMQNACVLLDIRIEDAKNLEPMFVEARKIESDESDSLYKCLIQVLPLVALIEAKEHCEEVQPYFAEIKAKFSALNIYEAKAIIKKDKSGREIEKPYADLYENNLYYVGRWNKDFTLKEIHEKIIEFFAFSTKTVRKNGDVFLKCKREDRIIPMLRKYHCDINLYKELVSSIKLNNNLELQLPVIDDSSQAEFSLDPDSQSTDSSEMRSAEMVEENKVAKPIIQAESVLEPAKNNIEKLTIVQPLNGSNTAPTSKNNTNTSVTHKKSPLKKSLENKTIEPVVAGNRNSDIKKKEKMNTFEPEIKKDELSTFDFSKVQLFKSVEPAKSLSVVKINNTNDPITKSNSGEFNAPKVFEKLSQETATAIGQWGEEFVYNKLKHHYQNKEKYQNAKFTDTEKGFKLQTTDIELEVVWENKNGETGKPYDMQISKKKSNEEKVERKIDVKATRNKDASLLSISEAEWKVATEYKNRYRIFRVYNAGSKEASIEKIKDPVALLKSDKITVAKIQFKL